jgi:1-acyl-sn-glycerol-3-phosphate acyltransferase
VSLANRFLTGSVRQLVRLLLGFYFSRIERFHPERVPGHGPVLFASNHPGSLTDAFLIGTQVGRTVHFVGTVQLFRWKPAAWLLRQCGIIAINRVQDDPHAMRSVRDTFEACYGVLERGGAVGIFPEGITYDDAQLKAVKTGAARMGLELEHRHGGALGLQILPVGLTYSGKERYRSEVLLHFGEPLAVAPFLEGYVDRRKEAIHALNAAIERRLQALILHLPRLEHERIVTGVKRLYLDRLKVGSLVLKEPLAPRAEELVLTQAIAAAVDHFARTAPGEVAQFDRKLQHYERWLRRLHLSDEAVGDLKRTGRLAGRNLGLGTLAALGLPLAAYGWLHRVVPAVLVEWVVRRMTFADRR